MNDYVFTPEERAASGPCMALIKTVLRVREKSDIGRHGGFGGDFLRSVLNRGREPEFGPWMWSSWAALLSAMIDHAQDIADELEERALVAQQSATRLRRAIDR